MPVIPGMSLVRGNRGWQPSVQFKLQYQGIQLYKSRHVRTCQLCRKHQSKYRRRCPICERLVAPGCWPVTCWSDELNHCRDCHTLIGVLKHHRFKLQYNTHEPDVDIHKTQPNVTSYLDLPIGAQITIMVYVFHIKDFVWSEYHTNKLPRGINDTCGCPSCTNLAFQLKSNNSPLGAFQLCKFYLPSYEAK